MLYEADSEISYPTHYFVTFWETKFRQLYLSVRANKNLFSGNEISFTERDFHLNLFRFRFKIPPFVFGNCREFLMFCIILKYKHFRFPNT